MEKALKIFCLCVSFIFVSEIFATPQRGDVLFWGGKRYKLFPRPLEMHEKFDKFKKQLSFLEKKCDITDCYLYQAEWIIIDSKLYLKNICSCCYFEDSLKIDFNRFFPKIILKNGLLRADWVTGELWISKGKEILYDHNGIGSICEKDLRLTFKNGILIKVKEFDNTNFHISKYTEEPELLKKFIYSNINWKNLPELDAEEKKVFISFEADESKKPRNIEIMRGSEDIFNKEAVRVVSLIPEWTVYFWRGELYRQKWTIPIIFNYENKKKYAH